MSTYTDSDDEAKTSTSILQSQENHTEKTTILTDNFTLYDVLQKLKDQARMMATSISQLDQYLNLIKNPVNPSTHLEVLKVKRNVINDITHLLKETKPLDYPCFQSLCSVKLLKTYEKVSSECKLLLNNIKRDNDTVVKRVDRFKKLTLFITDFQQEVDNIISQNTINTEVEHEIAREFKECKSDMYTLLLEVDPSSSLKEILSLLVECKDESGEDAWVDFQDLPHLLNHCYKLKKNGFVLQNEQNNYLFKLNI